MEEVHADECIILWQFEVGSTNKTSRVAAINPVMKAENGLPNLDYSALWKLWGRQSDYKKNILKCRAWGSASAAGTNYNDSQFRLLHLNINVPLALSFWSQQPNIRPTEWIRSQQVQCLKDSAYCSRQDPICYSSILHRKGVGVFL